MEVGSFHPAPAIFLSPSEPDSPTSEAAGPTLCEHMLRFPAELGTRSGQNTEGRRGSCRALAVSGHAAASPGFLLGLWLEPNGLCVWVCVCVRACLSACESTGVTTDEYSLGIRAVAV